MVEEGYLRRNVASFMPGGAAPAPSCTCPEDGQWKALRQDLHDDWLAFFRDAMSPLLQDIKRHISEFQSDVVDQIRDEIGDVKSLLCQRVNNLEADAYNLQAEDREKNVQAFSSDVHQYPCGLNIDCSLRAELTELRTLICEQKSGLFPQNMIDKIDIDFSDVVIAIRKCVQDEVLPALEEIRREQAQACHAHRELPKVGVSTVVEAGTVDGVQAGLIEAELSAILSEIHKVGIMCKSELLPVVDDLRRRMNMFASLANSQTCTVSSNGLDVHLMLDCASDCQP